MDKYYARLHNNQQKWLFLLKKTAYRLENISGKVLETKFSVLIN